MVAICAWRQLVQCNISNNILRYGCHAITELHLVMKDETRYQI